MSDNQSLLIRAIIYGTFIIGLGFALIGVWLVYFGASGETEIYFFGQNFKSVNVGISAVFIGGAIIVILIKRAFKSIDLGINNSTFNKDRTDGLSEKQTPSLNIITEHRENSTINKDRTDGLSEKQTRLLNIIAEHKERGIYTMQLEKEAGLGLNREGIIYRCRDLERNGYITIQALTDFLYKITKEGEEYLKVNKS
ncbi:MAG: hypothetical protein JJU34_01525 [Lunatimonas sp.]|uniref:hypothetical protein n=1 Tax=Lunatimonas sp. TaxID=2060141 RepID=UPI00263B4A18|nr:hypothetical protein [Lunatimonas sp.]MCC5935937.1 hypothetical protein [Lunatimonas sp.]